MSKDTCKCGEASTVYKQIGEDQFEATIIHSTVKKQKKSKVIGFTYGSVVECNSCHDQYSWFDPSMIKLIDTRYY